MTSNGKEAGNDEWKMRWAALLTGGVLLLLTLASTLFAVSLPVAGGLAVMVGIATALLAARQETPTQTIQIGSHAAAGVFVLGGVLAAWAITPEAASGWMAEVLSVGQTAIVVLFAVLAIASVIVGVAFRRKT